MLAGFAPLLAGEAKEHAGADQQDLECQPQRILAARTVLRDRRYRLRFVVALLVFLIFEMRQVDLGHRRRLARGSRPATSLSAPQRSTCIPSPTNPSTSRLRWGCRRSPRLKDSRTCRWRVSPTR